MASFYNHHLLPLYLLLIVIISTTTSASDRPKSLVLTIIKDASTSQYTTTLLQRTPPVSVALTLDLATPYLWLNCGTNSTSSTFKPVNCGCPLCDLANSNTCYNNICRVVITNPITHESTPEGSDLATDVVQVNSSNGATTVGLVSVPNFLFACPPTCLIRGLAKGVSGIAGFARTRASVPTQFSSYFSLAQIFAFCLSPSRDRGFAFIGDGPYNITPAGTGGNVDLRSTLTYTPLITNPVRPSEYFIGVQAINVGGKDVPVNKSLLSIDRNGNGGTTISLLTPYTTFETSIYRAVTTEFDNQVKANFDTTKRVAPVEPFEFCYDTFPGSPVGPSVMPINLVLQSEEVVWRIDSLNSLVRTNGVYCLGFVDGGKNPESSIVIGGYQIENNLVQFDLVKSRIGFSSSLVSRRMSCFNFNFTSTGLSLNPYVI